jgi:NUDIX domain
MACSQLDIPNLNGKSIKLAAKDDAAFVRLVRVMDIATGKKAMPFLHVWFALFYYRDYVKDMKLTKLFELALVFSRLRNIRLMHKVNAILAEKGLVLFKFTPEMVELEKDLDRHIAEAREFGFDPTTYLDEATDEDDVPQCSNDWCCKQNTEAGKASDNVVIVTDCDGVDWFVLIVRKNGPGRSQLAWAGGFVDPNESFKACSARELDEEMDMSVQGSYRVTKTVLPNVLHSDWDPRAKFPFGMEVGATVTHYDFTHLK